MKRFIRYVEQDGKFYGVTRGKEIGSMRADGSNNVCDYSILTEISARDFPVGSFVLFKDAGECRIEEFFNNCHDCAFSKSSCRTSRVARFKCSKETRRDKKSVIARKLSREVLS
jgi:hypothetical protein